MKWEILKALRQERIKQRVPFKIENKINKTDEWQKKERARNNNYRRLLLVKKYIWKSAQYLVAFATAECWLTKKEPYLQLFSSQLSPKKAEALALASPTSCFSHRIKAVASLPAYWTIHYTIRLLVRGAMRVPGIYMWPLAGLYQDAVSARFTLNLALYTPRTSIFFHRSLPLFSWILTPHEEF